MRNFVSMRLHSILLHYVSASVISEDFVLPRIEEEGDDAETTVAITVNGDDAGVEDMVTTLALAELDCCSTRSISPLLLLLLLLLVVVAESGVDDDIIYDGRRKVGNK